MRGILILVAFVCGCEQPSSTVPNLRAVDPQGMTCCSNYKGDPIPGTDLWYLYGGTRTGEDARGRGTKQSPGPDYSLDERQIGKVLANAEWAHSYYGGLIPGDEDPPVLPDPPAPPPDEED